MPIPVTIRQKFTPYLSGERPTFATVLVGIVVHLYGPEALNWEGVTLQLQLKDDLDCQLPPRQYDQVMALLTALGSDLVYTDVAAFDQFVNALNGHGYGVQKDAPEVDELAWAVTELAMNDPEPHGRDRSGPFDDQIGRYCRAVLDGEGFSDAPSALRWVPKRKIRLEGTTDADTFSAGWEAGRARADEVDEAVEQASIRLVSQMQELGLMPIRP